VSWSTLSKYLDYMQKGALLHILRGSRGHRTIQAPNKILLNNPNLFAVLCAQADIGAIRESFLVSQLLTDHQVHYHHRGDFLVDDKIVLKVGGKSKEAGQIKDLENAYLAIDDIESIPVGVDANGSYTWEGRDPLLELDRIGVAYIEQPFAADDLDAHTRLRDEIVAPVALDEPIDSEVAAIRVIERGAADLIVVKPSRLGVTASRTIHDVALAAGLRIKASGLIETAVGRAHTLAIASLPAAVFSDVARPGWFLTGGVEPGGTDGPAGTITALSRSGAGVDPDPEIFAPYVVGESPLGSRIWD